MLWTLGCTTQAGDMHPTDMRTCKHLHPNSLKRLLNILNSIFHFLKIGSINHILQRTKNYKNKWIVVLKLVF